jgi:hypothetical protein
LITFFNKNKGIGGGENLIINLAEYFYSQLNITVKIICYKDSYIYNRLSDLKISFVFIDMLQENFDADLTSKDVIIKTDPENINWFKNSTARMVYWEILPTVLANTINPSKKIFFKQLLFNYVLKNKGLFFMDINGVEELQSRGYKIVDYQLLPIPAFIPITYNTRKRNDNSDITITYLGRAENWKIFPFKKVLDDLGNLDQLTFKVVIFCNDEAPYKKIIKDTYKNISISYFVNKYGKELEELLDEKSDCHFAMGTSAIDSAKMGIPTVLLDYSNNTFPEDYKYQFIFEAKGFSLGNSVEKAGYKDYQKSITDICDCILSAEKYKEISKKCYDYVNDYHNIKTIATDVFKNANNSTTYISKVCKYFTYAGYENKIRKIIQPNY